MGKEARYLTAGNGRMYTILYPEGYKVEPGKNERLMTYELLSNAMGKTSDLRLTGLSLPEKPKEFTHLCNLYFTYIRQQSSV